MSLTLLLAGGLCGLIVVGVVVMVLVVWAQNRQIGADIEPNPPLSPTAAPSGALTGDLESQIAALMLQGNKLEAIKVYRAATQVGLKEAKQAVEAMENGQPLPRFGALPNDELPSTVMTNLEGQVANLLRQDRKLEAIKIYRAATNLGLAEAKAAVEAIERGLLG